MSLTLITLDFETYYDKDYSLRKLTAEEYVRDPRFEVIGVGVKINNGRAEWYSDPDPAVLKDRFTRSRWDDKVVLGHNMSGFDALVLTQYFNVRPAWYACTYAMARALHGGKEANSLASLATRYGLPAKGDEVVRALGKRRADFTPEELAAYGDYCMKDCEIAYQLYQILRKRLPAQEQRLVHLFTKMFAEPRVELDRDMLVEYRDKLARDRQALLENSGVTREALRSDHQFAQLLIDLGVDPPTKISKRTGKAAYAFAKTDPQMTALLEHEDPRVQALAAARVGTKSSIEETRVDRFIGIAERGMLPIPLVYGKTHTHRASGGGKINLQNLGRGSVLRKAIRAPEGKVLVVADSSNIELRVAHCLSGQMDTVEKLKTGVDMYCEFAQDLYGYPVNGDDNPRERQHGKVAMLQLQYQSGATAFKNASRIMGGLDLSMEVCQNTVDLFRTKFSEIRRFWYNCQDAIADMHRGRVRYIDMWELCRTGKDLIELPNGMVLNYANLRQEHHEDFGVQWMYDDKEERWPKKVYGGAITENLCQALARIVVFDQMLEIEKRYGRYDDATSGVVLTVHDEVVAVVDEDKGEECLKFMVDVMCTPPSWWPQLPVFAKGGLAKCYGDAK